MRQETKFSSIRMGSGQMGMGMHRSSLTVETLAASKQDRLKVSSSGAWSVAENRQLKLEFDSGMRMEQMVSLNSVSNWGMERVEFLSHGQW